MIRKQKALVAFAALGLAAPALLLLGDRSTTGSTSAEERGAHEEEIERGPHRGRLLRDRDFAVEITIFEEGVPPEFHIYAYDDGEPIPPSAVRLSITLSRLGGKQDQFTFAPVADYLKSAETVREPHSFDVRVEAEHKNRKSVWSFASYEGRTTIMPEAARSAGVRTEAAGPAKIRQIEKLTGRITLNRNTAVEIKARYPGVVREVVHVVGETVEAGEVVARIERNVGLKVYAVTSPIAGALIERNVNAGSLTTDEPLLVVADLSDVWAELHVFPRELQRIRAGQRVKVQSLDGQTVSEATIESILPVAASESQTVIARATIPNPDGRWRPGMMVRSDVAVAEVEVALAVKVSALQRFRDFTVVFAKVKDTYEVRMLDLGVRDDTWVEVRGGIDPGEAYVAENSFLIKADIEKSGASHDH
jgi:cobalt-zinc-cadmium efflux system membrane fusion protein